MSTELTQVSKALADMDAVSVGLATLREKFGGVVFEVSTAQGMTDAKAARAAIRDPRYSVESIRKEAKAPILALGKKLDAEAKRITDELLKIENPIQEQIAAEESRKERERQAKVAAELARVKDIQDRIENIRRLGSTLDAGPEAHESIIAKAEGLVIDDSYAEFRQSAQDAKDATLARLRQAHAAAVERDAERERIKAERAELDRLRADNARREAEERARREAEEATARKARQEEERRATEQRARQKAEDDRIAAERKAVLDAEQKRIDDARAEQERLEKEARETEARRQEERRQLNESRMSEINGIQHQVMIATLGRAGVRKGGTLECYQETLAETEAWPIEESNFGPMTAMAQKVKDSAIASIREGLAAFQQRQADKAESDRIAADRAALQRDQDALRKAQEPPPAPTRMRPKADDLVAVIASHYKVTSEVATRWLRSTDFGKAQDAA